MKWKGCLGPEKKLKKFLLVIHLTYCLQLIHFKINGKILFPCLSVDVLLN